MKFRITLSSTHPWIVLPLNYNALIQAAIYQNLSPDFGQYLHEHGFQVDKRQFRLFVFSRILGKYELLLDEDKIRFRSPIQLVISSPIDQFVHDITQVLLKDHFRIGNQLLNVEAMQVSQPAVKGNEILVRTLSPITVYSTMTRTDSRKYTVYFQPSDDDFKRLVRENLNKKVSLLYDMEAEEDSFQVIPIGSHRQHVVKFIKNQHETIIKAYSGRFILKGDIRYLQTAVDAGLGSKNSNGFGLVEMVEEG